MNVVWLARALKDLNAQLDYIAVDSPQAAINVLDNVLNQLSLLPEHPYLGRIGRIKDSRELVILHSSLILVYRVKPSLKRIEVLRCLHSAQKWP